MCLGLQPVVLTASYRRRSDIPDRSGLLLIAYSEANRCGTSRRLSPIPCPARFTPIPCPARQDGGEMSGTPHFAEPAAEMSGTRRGYTIVWLERFSCLGARWGMTPAQECQGEPRLTLPAQSSSRSDESEASASCSAQSRPVAHRPPSEGPPNRIRCKM